MGINVKKTTVVIPNYNGIAFMGNCLAALWQQTQKEFDVIVVDNGSTDVSLALVMENYPSVKVIRFPHNQGFCKAVNAGIKAAATPYVILLNNDTEVRPHFIAALERAAEQSEKIFSVSAKMLVMQQPDRMDGAGDSYCALGWAYAIGKGKQAGIFNSPGKVFSACGGAALYRKAVFNQIGMFDENHFAYLEDMDIGYRARIYGYENRFEPEAEVLHAGSGFSGSRYNEFKTNLSSRNSIYLIYKNMPLFQILLNSPFLLAGFTVKTLFFIKKGLGLTYVKGLGKGIGFCFGAEAKRNKVKYKKKNLLNYLRIQKELWLNIKNLI